MELDRQASFSSSNERQPPSLLNLPTELCTIIVSAVVAPGRGPGHGPTWSTDRRRNPAPHELDVDWFPLRDRRRDVVNLLLATARPRSRGAQPNIAEVCADALWAVVKIRTGEQVEILDRGISLAGFGNKSRASNPPLGGRVSGLPLARSLFGAVVSLFRGPQPAAQPVQGKSSTGPQGPPPAPPLFSYVETVRYLRIDATRPSELRRVVSFLRQLRVLEHLTFGYAVDLPSASTLFALLEAVNGGTPEGRARMRGLEILNTAMSPAEVRTGDRDEVAKVWTGLFDVLPNLTTIWIPHWSPPNDPSILLRALERKWTSGEGLGIERMYVILNGYSPENILEVAKRLVAAEDRLPALLQPEDAGRMVAREARPPLTDFVLYARPGTNDPVFAKPLARTLVENVVNTLCASSIEHFSCMSTFPVVTRDQPIERGNRLPKLTVMGSFDIDTPQIPDVESLVRFLSVHSVEQLNLRYTAFAPSKVDLQFLAGEGPLHSLLKLQTFSCLGGLYVASPGPVGLDETAPDLFDFDAFDLAAVPAPPTSVQTPSDFFACMVHFSAETLESLEIVDNAGGEDWSRHALHLWRHAVTVQVLGVVARRLRGTGTGRRALHVRVGSHGFGPRTLEGMGRAVVRLAERAAAGGEPARLALKLEIDCQSWPFDSKREICEAMRVAKYRKVLPQQGAGGNVFAHFPPVSDTVVGETFRLTIGTDRPDSMAEWAGFMSAWDLVRSRPRRT